MMKRGITGKFGGEQATTSSEYNVISLNPLTEAYSATNGCLKELKFRR